MFLASMHFYSNFRKGNIVFSWRLKMRNIPLFIIFGALHLVLGSYLEASEANNQLSAETVMVKKIIILF